MALRRLDDYAYPHAFPFFCNPTSTCVPTGCRLLFFIWMPTSIVFSFGCRHPIWCKSVIKTKSPSSPDLWIPRVRFRCGSGFFCDGGLSCRICSVLIRRCLQNRGLILFGFCRVCVMATMWSAWKKHACFSSFLDHGAARSLKCFFNFWWADPAACSEDELRRLG